MAADLWTAPRTRPSVWTCGVFPGWGTRTTQGRAASMNGLTIRRWPLCECGSAGGTSTRRRKCITRRSSSPQLLPIRQRKTESSILSVGTMETGKHFRICITRRCSTVRMRWMLRATCSIRCPATRRKLDQRRLADRVDAQNRRPAFVGPPVLLRVRSDTGIFPAPRCYRFNWCSRFSANPSSRASMPGSFIAASASLAVSSIQKLGGR